MEKKHCYTPAEKREFLKIIKKYGHIIDNRSTDNNSSRRKTIAWNRIACEYNTSSISPYPASSKQLRRLWMNMKQRNKVSIAKLESDPPAGFEDDIANGTSQEADIEEESTTPFFVNVGNRDNQEDLLKDEIAEGGTTQEDSYTATGSEGQAFELEYIDDMEDDERLRRSAKDKEYKDTIRVRSNILVKEYQDRRRRQNELHLLQKRLLIEQVREARAKANLAELELRQQKYLE